MYKEVIKPTLVLIIISVIVSGMLALTYNATGVGELGKGISQAELDTYIKEVLPQGSKLLATEIKVEDPAILGIYKDESQKGIAIHLTTKGYGGQLKLLVGLDMDGKFTGAKVLESAETPGLGTKIENPEFIAKYVGTSKSVALTKDGGTVDGIAGATISSRAFTTGANKAFEIFEKVKGDL